MESERLWRFAVLGAGHGGTAMAGHLSLMGHDVSLYNRGEDRIRPIKAAGGLEIVTDAPNLIPSGFAKLEVVTSDPAEAIRGRDILMVVVPATGHGYIGSQIAPHLSDGQMVVLNPGRTGGALEVHKVIRDSGCKAEVIVAEAQTFIYASRSINPALEKTVAGVRKIAKSGVVDVISIAPDQNAQESFFRPEDMDPKLDGAGGVPVRTRDDLLRIYRAGRRGNYPLLRIYSGTRDLVKWAELATETINNAWGAIPLCWYSSLDGRSKRTPSRAIRENQEAMRWYGERGIPVEVNESHHWSMRDAHDTIAVVMAYLAAYNAKKMGVRHYIAQYMFNSPPMTYGAMDLAKMLAKMQLIGTLHDDRFATHRQVRAGLLHLSPRPNIAKGQLSASTMLAMQLKPDIIHVVGYCEGDHAATPEDVIESCEIVHGALRNSLIGMPDMTIDPLVRERKDELLSEARVLLAAMQSLGNGDADPLACPRLLAHAIKTGILDAPQLRGNTFAAGTVRTKVIDGAVYAVDPLKKRVLSESERLCMLPGFSQRPKRLRASVQLTGSKGGM